MDPLAVRLTGYVPEPPHPKQHAFLALDGMEAFYGGSAGGGKSGGLLMAALQYVDVPGYAALLLRKTHAQLNKAESILSQCHSWLRGTDAKWSGSSHTYYFPSGATVEFGHLQHETDKYNYQGAAYQFIGFDELTQFLESEYRYLFSRCRGPAICPDHEDDEGVIVTMDDQPVMVCSTCEHPAPPAAMIPLRTRSASNPGGAGHLWVRSRFIRREVQAGDEERSEENPYGVLGPDGQLLTGERLFIPASLSDNPSLNARAYRAQMQGLDPQTRQQLLDGDWDVREPGACFTEFNWAEHTVENTRAKNSPWPVYRGIDFGLHHAPCLWMEVYGNSVFIFAELHSQGQDLHKFAEDIREVDAEFGVEDCEAYIDPAGLSTSYQTGKTDADVLREHGISVANTDTKDRYSPASRTSLIKTLLREHRIYISRTECPYLTEALQRAVWDTHAGTGAPKDTYKKDQMWEHPLDAVGEALIRIFRPLPAQAIETEAVAIATNYGAGYGGSEFG